MTKFARRDVVRLGASALGTVAFVGTLSAPAIRRAQAAETIAFGGSIPLSGRAAETGLNVHNGYETAVKFFNEEMGGVEIGGRTYTLELSMFDDASDPQRAVTLLQGQLDRGTNFFLGSFSSSIVLPVAAICERARKPLVQAGGGSDQIFTQGYHYTFGLYPRASRQFLSTVAFFNSLEPKPRGVVIISTNDAFSKTQAGGAAKDLSDAGYEILGQHELPATITDASSVLSAVRAAEPDIVICTTHDENSLLLTRQMASTGTNTKLLYEALGPQLESFRSSLGKYANAITFPKYWDENVPYADPYFGSAEKFAAYYRAHFDRPLAYHTAAGAACIECFVKAMQDGGSIDPQAVRDALAALDFETFYKRIKFTADGDGDPVLLGPAVAQVQAGETPLVFPKDAAYAQPIYPMPTWEERA